MAKITVYSDIGTKVLAEGVYEYVEAGLEKDGKPSFHISLHNKTTSSTIYMTFDDKTEFEEFLNSLKDQMSNAENQTPK